MSKAKVYDSPELVEKQQRYYESLSEKRQRHFLAMEFERLGEGSKHYLSRVFGCGRQTIRKGLRELAESNYQPDYSRQRKAGGGRKKRSHSGGAD